ncbi:hypothetical protein IEQ34_008349 [Dendrobium chrysotoxum]|uniref:MADS-box domain-containing protein n=1 Tax=Dendrobium chrysotoxum TaxID=161865 RepID=A0AAV7GZ59_DENCH|nr:hypothetical protein IEQ34_008349 [Dendrobium chrysotoxum]
MARKKTTLTYISNDAICRATLKKRCRGLLKKVNELSILCDISACTVVYSLQTEQPDVFPSVEEVKKILTDLTNMSEIDKNKKMVNQRSFLEQRLVKLIQQLRRLEHENKELSTAVLSSTVFGAGRSVDSLSKEEVDDMLDLVDRKLKALEVRMHQLGPLMLPPVMLEDMDVKVDGIGYEGVEIEGMREYEWITGNGCVGVGVGEKVMGGGEGSGVVGSEGAELMEVLIERLSGSRSAWEESLLPLPAPYY